MLDLSHRNFYSPSLLFIPCICLSSQLSLTVCQLTWVTSGELNVGKIEPAQSTGAKDDRPNTKEYLVLPTELISIFTTTKQNTSMFQSQDLIQPTPITKPIMKSLDLYSSYKTEKRKFRQYWHHLRTKHYVHQITYIPITLYLVSFVFCLSGSLYRAPFGDGL